MRLAARRALCTFVALIMGLVAGFTTITTAAPRAEAAPATGLEGFTAGRLISDAAFYDADALTSAEVVAFIAAKGARCINNTSSGVPCLKNYRTSTPAVAATAYCSAIPAVSGSSAGSIIARVSKACGISPAVLLAMIQKESALLSASGSSLTARRYATATGAGCPDFATCDAGIGNFFNQVYKTASLFSMWRAVPSKLNYKVGVNQLLYNPERTCGRATVTIANVATASLYTYTPFVPNTASLRAVSGEGDACSTYGNRNFYRLMKLWFPAAMGSSTAAPVAPSPASTVLPQLTNTLAERVRVGSVLGYATGSMTCTAVVCTKPYSKGRIYAAGTWARAVYPPIYAAYSARGGAGGSLGLPTGQAVCGTSGTCTQAFAGGTIRVSGGSVNVSASTTALAWTKLTTTAKEVTSTRVTGGWELLRIGTDNKIYRRTYLNGTPSTWRLVTDRPAVKIEASTNASGRVELFFVGTDRRVYHATEKAVGGAYSAPVDLGGTATDVTAARSGSGWVVFRISATGTLWRRASSASSWTSIPGTATAIAAATGGSGRPSLFRVSSGKVYRSNQTSSGTFGTWSSLGGGGASDLAATFLANGSLELYTASTTGTLSRLAPASGSSSWTRLNGSATAVTAKLNAFGKIDLVRVTATGTVYRAAQRSPGVY